MSVFKQFLSQDVIVTPFQVNKSFLFNGGNSLTSSNVNIDRFVGRNVIGTFHSSSDPLTGHINPPKFARGIYNSVKTLYYSNYISSSKGDEATKTVIDNGVILEINNTQPRFENYLQSTLTQSRYFPTGSNAQLGVISIPNRLFGEQIQPTTFYMNSSTSGSIRDDGEGNILSGSLNVGNIFYSHGLIVLTNTQSIIPFCSSSNVTMSFNSTYTIHETQYKCTIRESEFNFSLNPTILSGSSNDTAYNFVTGSFFSPYITMVGLYNDQQELLAVAKMAQPLPSSRTNDLNIIINLDR